MRVLLKRKKDGIKETIYQFNVGYGLLVQHIPFVFYEGEQKDDIDETMQIKLIQFDPETEEGFKGISKFTELFSESELEERLIRLDTLLNTRRLWVVQKNFNKFDISSDIEFNSKEKRVSYIPK